jgi:hypothetical protein
MQSDRLKYKSEFNNKYGKSFEKADEDRLNNLVEKINDFIDKVSSTYYSDELKEKFLPMLFGLRDVIDEKLNN